MPLRTAIVAAMIASTAPLMHAGEIKTRHWPMSSILQACASVELPVTVNVGPFAAISPASVRLEQVGFQAYEGRRGLRVRCNFRLTLVCSVVPTGAVGGQYSCSIANPHIDPPGGTAELCVRLTDAQIENHPPGNNVRVAIVKVTVVPGS
jgi:hypothetical protein